MISTDYSKSANDKVSVLEVISGYPIDVLIDRFNEGYVLVKPEEVKVNAINTYSIINQY